MKTKRSNKLSRRSFLEKSMLGMAGLTILPRIRGFALNDNINLGFIGLGQQSMFLMSGFLTLDGVKVLAGADVYGIKRKRLEKRVKDYYASKGLSSDVTTYENYQHLLARKDIDAVVIAVPDHWHALVAMDALKSGKDVYLEKPMTFTIQEGKTLRSAVRKYNRILAVGSQQRSDPNFRHAVNMVQQGKIGNIERINAYVGDPPKPYDLPKEIIPSDLNWNLWLGPNPYVHYNHELDPPISLDPEVNEQLWGAWRWYKETGGGFTTDWGAHMFDIAQWGLGMDNSGPVEISPAGYKDYKYLTYKYKNGTVMTEEPFNAQMTKGVKFWGTDGWIEISREFYRASKKELEPQNLIQESGPYETRIPHQVNFIESVRAHKDPIVPVGIGHRSATVCNLGNISYELGRTIKWDPAREEFVNDPEAGKYMHRQYREGYKLPEV